MAESEAFRRGAETRRRVMGDEVHNRSFNTTDPVLRKFQEATAETLWAVIWNRPGLDLKTRALICVISDAATGRTPELATHLRIALYHGWTPDELTEALIHLLGYIGAPLVREAILTAREVFGESKAGA